jgi:hypothetical protein
VQVPSVLSEFPLSLLPVLLDSRREAALRPSSF